VDYERGLHVLRRAVEGNEKSLLDFALQESRFRDNLARAARFGDSAPLTAERASILEALNALALGHARKTFSDLCAGSPGDDETPDRLLRSAVPNFGSTADSGDKWVGRRLEEVIEQIGRVDAECGFDERDYVALKLTSGTRAKTFFREIAADRKEGGGGEGPAQPRRHSDRKFGSIEDVFDAIAPGPGASLVLLGDPGSGKSVSIRHLGQELARRGLKKKRPPDKPRLVPVYIHLGDYVGKTMTGNVQPLRDFILSRVSYSGEQQERQARSNFEGLAQRGELVFLLDSMDEMPRDDYSARYDELRHFVHSFPLCRYVFTCRKVDYDHRLNVTEIVVEPLPAATISRYIRRFLVERCEWSRADADDLVIRLERKHKENLYEILRNPFYLRLVSAHIAAYRDLPASLAQLYEQLLRASWDHLKERGELSADLGYDDFVSALSWIAYCITREAGTGTTIRVEDLAMISVAAGLTPPPAKQVSDAIKLAKTMKLLQVRAQGGECIAFQHHRFQEYFTAVFLCGREDTLNAVLPKTGLLGGIWWQETVTLLTAISAVPDKVVTYLLGIKGAGGGDLWRLQAHLLEGEKLELLARCYQVAKERLHPQTIFRILSALVADIRRADTARRVLYVKVLASLQHPKAEEYLSQRLDDASSWVREEAFQHLLRAKSKGALDRRYTLGHLAASFWQGRGILRGVAVARALVKSGQRRELVPLALLTSFLSLIVGFWGAVLPLAFAFTFLSLGLSVPHVLLATLPVFYPTVSYLRIWRVINLRRQLPWTAATLVYGLIVYTSLTIIHSVWVLPVCIVLTLVLMTLGSRIGLGTAKFDRLLEEGMNHMVNHERWQEDLKQLAQSLAKSGRAAGPRFFDDLFHLYNEGCLHVHQHAVRVLREVSLDMEGYERLRMHAGELNPRDNFHDDIWMIVHEKELQVRRLLAERDDTVRAEALLNGKSGSATN
jgi:NACHT domain